ncbi:MAG: hypothetical protein AABW80_02940 [Nanoarchaeota archaeon]
MQKQISPSVQEKFLEAFFIELINAVKTLPSDYSLFYPKKETAGEIITETMEKSLNSVVLKDSNTSRPILITKPLVRQRPIMKSFPIRNTFRPEIISHPSSQPEVHRTPPPLTSVNMPHLNSLGKINNFILDPSISLIECLGQGKPIIITRSGLVQVTNVALAESEIKAIMDEISAETRIPLVIGLFKAVLGILHITAIISEHVGIRFIFEKRRLVNPMHLP